MFGRNRGTKTRSIEEIREEERRDPGKGKREFEAAWKRETDRLNRQAAAWKAQQEKKAREYVHRNGIDAARTLAYSADCGSTNNTGYDPDILRDAANAAETRGH